MLVDARSVPAGTIIETEVCVVGAGAAGITLAREFINSGFRVVLLESGSIDFEEATQKLYAGSDIGRSYFAPDSAALRLRFFGGTTNHWGGWCALPDAADFEKRDSIPYSGWPFSRAYLEPWYQRAQVVLQLGPFGYSPSDWGIGPADIPPPFNGPSFTCQVLQVSPPTRFGFVYGSELRGASRLTVYLNANALHFDTSENNSQVDQLSVGIFPSKRLTVRARIYVLAAGGIENARLLLLSGKKDGNGLGNERDLVGRFFMVHLEYPGGILALANEHANFKFNTGVGGASYDRFGVPRRFVSYVCLSDESRRKLGFPQLHITFAPVTDAAGHGGGFLQDLQTVMRDLVGDSSTDTNLHRSIMQDLRAVMRDIYYAATSTVKKNEYGSGALLVHCSSEQMPNPDSRIELGKMTDPFGLREVAINWQLTVQDKRGMVAAHRLFGAEVGRVGYGRFRTSVPDDDSTWPEHMWGNQHNIGTTRMHQDAQYGVVDENCRVHGVANLYVAGSSVFPTEGTANPTYTIVALALRLADHIKDRLK